MISRLAPVSGIWARSAYATWSAPSGRSHSPILISLDYALAHVRDWTVRHFPTSLTPFLGRETRGRRRDHVRASDARLVTLTGPGGIGKTRIALEVGERVASEFADGVVFVDLAPLREVALVLPAIASALGLREAAGRPLHEVVQGYLAERQILLVLDNFEHLLDAATSSRICLFPVLE